MRWQDHISVDATVAHGTACITGTRIPVAVVRYLEGRDRLEMPAGTELAATSGQFANVRVSPDGRSLAAVTDDHELMLFPLDGGQPIALDNVGPKEMVCQWSEDSSTIYTYHQGAPLEVFAIDVKSRRRRLWRSFTPPEAGGVALSFVMTRDARSYAYGYDRRHHELYVAGGLR